MVLRLDKIFKVSSVFWNFHLYFFENTLPKVNVNEHRLFELQGFIPQLFIRTISTNFYILFNRPRPKVIDFSLKSEAPK
jgi:hypothetical protein